MYRSLLHIPCKASLQIAISILRALQQISYLDYLSQIKEQKSIVLNISQLSIVR